MKNKSKNKEKNTVLWGLEPLSTSLIRRNANHYTTVTLAANRSLKLEFHGVFTLGFDTNDTEAL